MSYIFRMPVKSHPGKDQSYQANTDKPNLRKSKRVYDREPR